MKKWIAFLLGLTMVLAFTACGDSGENTTETTAEETTAAVETEAPDEPETSGISTSKEFTSDIGFNMEVPSVALTPEGQVIMRTEGDLEKAVGSEVPLAEGVTNLYVEPFGNGVFYSIMMIKEDKTVSAVNSTVLMNDKKVEIMDKLGGYEDVVRVEPVQSADAHTINVVMGNGDAYPLDPYLK